jgi:hypothetical protein
MLLLLHHLVELYEGCCTFLASLEEHGLDHKLFTVARMIALSVMLGVRALS